MIIAEVNIDSHKEDILAALGDQVEAALEEIGIAAEGIAKMLCPVDTGRLRNSIAHTYDASEKSVYIGSNVEYAPYVEMGTSRTRAQPYLRPAVENHAEEYRQIALKHIKE